MRHAICAPLAAVLLLFLGCASSHMVEVPLAERTDRPRPGASIVHFLRSPMMESRIPRALLFDDDYYIGRLEQGQQVAYETKPGRHRFMVVSLDADFLEAELEPDKVYYVSVRRRIRNTRLTFSLVPNNDERSIVDAVSRAAASEEVRPNDAGRRWGEQTRAHYDRIEAKWLPVWEVNLEKPRLLPSSGQ